MTLLQVTTTVRPATGALSEPSAFNAGGLVFFAIVAILAIAAAVLYLRNRPVASPGADGSPHNP